MGPSMTHDELLKAINTVEYPWWMQDAIRAIVELHKPIEGEKTSCGSCYDLAYPPSGLYMEYRDYAYPCPTIQAIINELSND